MSPFPLVIVKFATCGDTRIFISVFLPEVIEKGSQPNVSLKVNGKYCARSASGKYYRVRKNFSGLANRNYQQNDEPELSKRYQRPTSRL